MTNYEHKPLTDGLLRDAFDRKCGNPDLPIDAYRDVIVDAVNTNQSVVISAETGAGKSTQVPQYLAEAGYEVIVTQPRVLAATSVADRVRDEIGSPNLVGYQTSKQKDTHPDNIITFCTDGLQMVRELAGRGVGSKNKQVLVLDEVHEWNTNMEVLVAWAKQRMAEDPDFRVVTMSATLDGEALAKYFDGNTPHIEVPGRTYEVSKRVSEDVYAETLAQAQAGRNILVFLPGKKEIDELAQRLVVQNIGVPIIPLHGQLDKADQRKAFEAHKNGKIVLATNVAQTSITIPDIDVVIDSGMERRTEIRGGVEGLYLANISKADCMQRAGRAGRTKPGEYILASHTGKVVTPLEDREAYPTPEIKRTRLDNTTLKLLGAGIDIAEMDFFHQPDPGEIRTSKERLTRLGAIDNLGHITSIGRRMERMPLETHYSRMIVEAQIKSYPPEVIGILIDAIAIQQTGGVVKNGKYNRAWRSLTNTTDSDLLAELDVYYAALDLNREQRTKADVIGKNVDMSRSTMRQIRSALRVNGGTAAKPSDLSPEHRTEVLKCIVAGMIDQIWFGSHGTYEPALLGDSGRELSSSSVVSQEARCVVAGQFDLGVLNRRGGTMTLRFLQGATKVDPKWLTEIAPQLLSTVSDTYRGVLFDQAGYPYQPGKLMFGNLELDSAVITPEPEKIHEAIFNALNLGKHKKSRQYLHWRSELYTLATEVAVFDPEYAKELKARFENILRSMIDASQYDNIYDAMAAAPTVHDYDVFGEDDFNRVESIQSTYPSSIVLDNSDVDVAYQVSYGNTSPDSYLTVTKNQLYELATSPFATGKRVYVTLSDEGYGHRPTELSNAARDVQEKEQKLREESLDREAIEAGRVQDIGGPVRWFSGSNNKNYWVVKPDGNLREADSSGTWKVLRKGEVFLSADCPSKDILAGSLFEMTAPDGFTDKQLDAVGAIEDGLVLEEQRNAPLWLGKEYGELDEDALYEALITDGFIGPRIDDYGSPARALRELWSDTGLRVTMDAFRTYDTLMPDTLEYVFKADGREAAQIDLVQVTRSYAIQVLIYDKYGDWNVAFKLVENSADYTYDELDAPASEDLTDALNKLAARFGS